MNNLEDIYMLGYQAGLEKVAAEKKIKTDLKGKDSANGVIAAGRIIKEKKEPPKPGSGIIKKFSPDNTDKRPWVDKSIIKKAAVTRLTPKFNYEYAIDGFKADKGRATQAMLPALLKGGLGGGAIGTTAGLSMGDDALDALGGLAIGSGIGSLLALPHAIKDSYNFSTSAGKEADYIKRMGAAVKEG